MAPSRGAVNDPAYEALMAELAGMSKPGDVLFLKEGEYQVKLVLPQDAGVTADGKPNYINFKRIFNTFFKNKVDPSKMDTCPYMLIAGVVVTGTKEAKAAVNPGKVVYIKIPKTVFGDIMQVIGKWGFAKVFGESGQTITITRFGKNAKPPYKAGIDPDEFDINNYDEKGGVVSWPEMSLAEAAADQEARSMEMYQNEAAGKGTKAGAAAEDLA